VVRRARAAEAADAVARAEETKELKN